MILFEGRPTNANINTLELGDSELYGQVVPYLTVDL